MFVCEYTYILTHMAEHMLRTIKRQYEAKTKIKTPLPFLCLL